jgi:hypothetical protein
MLFFCFIQVVGQTFMSLFCAILTNEPLASMKQESLTENYFHVSLHLVDTLWGRVVRGLSHL